MGLNIKSERVHELARQLARETGKSMTAVIEEALEDKLMRLGRAQESEAIVDYVMRMVRECGPPPPGLTSDHSFLYDEHGLPK